MSPSARRFFIAKIYITCLYYYIVSAFEPIKMIENDPKDGINLIGFLKDSLPYLTTLILSCFGGVVSYIQKIRQKKKAFSWKELGFDLIVSSFAGLMTFYLCRYSSTDPELSAILIAVSGHMGTRAIAGFENLHGRVFNVQTSEYKNDK